MPLYVVCDGHARRLWRARYSAGSREEPPHVRGQGQKPGGPHARRAAAKRSYSTFEVRGSGGEYQTATAQERLWGVTPRLRSGAVAGRRYPTPHARGPGRWPGGPTPRPRSRGCARGGEEIPLVQGKEQWLRFAGAAMKSYPTPKVRETQVRR